MGIAGLISSALRHDAVDECLHVEVGHVVELAELVGMRTLIHIAGGEDVVMIHADTAHHVANVGGALACEVEVGMVVTPVEEILGAIGA